MKKDLVCQTGLHGILQLKLTKVNRQYGAWLLSKIDVDSCAIVADLHKVTPFSARDVNSVLGVPCSGRTIETCNQDEVERNKRILCDIFEVPHFSQVTVKFLEAILNKQYSYPMSLKDQRSFKAAFVLYVMTKFLAPQSLANYISTRYISAVADIDNISSYNWAQFIVDDLMNSASLMPKQFHNSSQVSINGCILFLQTIYLDHIAPSNNDVNCETSPRIAAFDDDLVTRIIMNDMKCKHNIGFPFPQFGKLQLTKPPSIYSRAPEEGSQENHHSTPSATINQPCVSNISEYLQTRFKSTKLRSIYGEEASSSIKDAISNAEGQFSSILQDTSDFENFFDNPVAIEATQKLNKILVTTVFNSIKIAVRATLRNVLSDNHNRSGGLGSHGALHSNPTSGLTPTSFSKDTASPCQHTSMPDRDHPQPASQGNIGSCSTTSNRYNNLASRTPPTTHNASASPSKQKSSISPASAARLAQEWTVALSAEDTNGDEQQRRYIVENPPSHLLRDKNTRKINQNKKLLSPFQTKQCSITRTDTRVARSTYSYIQEISNEALLDEVWLQSSCPFNISIKLRTLQQSIARGGWMDTDCLNFAIRKMFLDDVDRFEGTNYLGWRHFINLDFASYALAGGEFWVPEHQLGHFIGTHIRYDVSQSHQILIPLHLVNHYALYAFDMENKKISILDSLSALGPFNESRISRHNKTCHTIAYHLAECMRLAFPGWDEDIPSWGIEVVENIPEQQNSDDCGFLVLNFMRNWNGLRLINFISKDSNDLRCTFLLDLLTFKTNEASLPDWVKLQLSQLRD
ncbi:hypothetical protein VPH35_109036 [Triticum aestivum]